ncbi:MAG: EAL domain-containing protein [Janthinobacterium lividum]
MSKRRSYPVPGNEPSRLGSLRSLDVLGRALDPQLEAVVALACEAFDVPIAMVTLVDEDQQWLQAAIGVDFRSTPRELAICNYPVSSGRLFVVRDMLSDPRFADHPLVTDGPRMRCYAGVPLSPEPGVHIGTFCISDTKPRRFSSAQTAKLGRMALIVTRLLCQGRDERAVTDLQAKLARLNKTTERAERLAKIGSWDWRVDSDDQSWSDGMCDIHEVERGSIITPAQSLSFYTQAAVRKRIEQVGAVPTDGRQFRFEAEITTAKGNQRWVRVSGSAERENGLTVRRFGVKQDITEQKAISDRMEALATTDSLTGLLSRTAFLDRLLRDGSDNKARGRIAALLTIGLDGFKHINHTFGSEVGDACLKEVAERIRRLCPTKNDVAGRLSGDEFGMLVGAARSRAVLDRHCEAVLEEIRRPVRTHGHSLQLSASVGIAMSDDAGRLSDLFPEARLALFAAKQGGRNQWRSFTPEMKKEAESRFEVIRNVTKALDCGELVLFYQPKVSLADVRLTGFEALLRWQRPDGQVIAAAAFAAALADPGLSARIGDFVLDSALCQARQWHTDRFDFGHIAINLSISQFYDVHFAASLFKMIDGYGIEPGMIEIEVTESVLLSEGSIAESTIAAIRQAGIKVSLDDFGTGYASLTHLRSYPVDTIKIDRSFVMNCLTSQKDSVIVRSIIDLAHGLGLTVVAEGIETTAHLERLEELGCDYGQGYLFAKALPALEARHWSCPDPLHDGVEPGTWDPVRPEKRARRAGRSAQPIHTC